MCRLFKGVTCSFVTWCGFRVAVATWEDCRLACCIVRGREGVVMRGKGGF